jgi:hypothetical protein
MWSWKSFRFGGCSREFRYGRRAMQFNDQSKPAYVKIIRSKLRHKWASKRTGLIRLAMTKLSR